MKDRKTAGKKYTWDLTKFCKNDADCFYKIEELKKKNNKITSFKGKLNNPEKLLEFYELNEEIGVLASAAGMYIHNHLSCDLGSSTYNEMETILDQVCISGNEKGSFYESEMVSYSADYFKQLIADPRFKNHSFGLKKLLRKKKHILSEKEERVLAKTELFSDEFSSVFRALTNVDLKMEDVTDGQGNKLPMSENYYSAYVHSQDRTLRKAALESCMKAYEGVQNALAKNYIASVKSAWFYAEVKGFNSVLAQHRFEDNIKLVVYDNLVAGANKSLKHLHKYYELKAKAAGIENFARYDVYAPLCQWKQTYEFENCVEICKNALNPLGEDFTKLFDKAVVERWMDVYPTKNKRGGAYMSSVHGFTPVVLLNHDDTLDSLFTLAHEMGHAIHSVFSDTTQPRQTSGHTIFTAEVASIVNELLLIKYLYKNAQTKEEKLYLIDKYLSSFAGTFFRQTMFSEFEDYAHGLVERQEAISKDLLIKCFHNLVKKYYGPKVDAGECIKYEWLRIPHFYYHYYVYKYATGFVSAVTIVNNLLAGGKKEVEKYKKFLSSGSSNYSVELLKIAGVNLESQEPYEKTLAELTWALTELKKLV